MQTFLSRDRDAQTHSHLQTMQYEGLQLHTDVFLTQTGSAVSLACAGSASWSHA